MSETKEAAKAPKAKKEKNTDQEGGGIVHGLPLRTKKKSAWTLERCMKFAKRFKTEQEWAAGAPASYKSAAAHGWIAQCMPSKQSRRAG
jgi:hypothetical protein